MILETACILRRTGPVVITKPCGEPFYVMGGAGVFTLPAGAYVVKSGKVSVLGPMPPRPFEPGKPRRKLPDAFRVKVGANPSKASVHLPTGQILLDPSIAHAPDFVRTFVLAHEVGHFFHEDEAGADAFAARWMYCQGFNPSQVDAAARLSLQNCQRTEDISNLMRLHDGN